MSARVPGLPASRRPLRTSRAVRTLLIDNAKALRTRTVMKMVTTGLPVGLMMYSTFRGIDWGQQKLKARWYRTHPWQKLAIVGMPHDLKVKALPRTSS